jgi:hypothetical protein
MAAATCSAPVSSRRHAVAEADAAPMLPPPARLGVAFPVVFFLATISLLPQRADAQTQYFETLSYRDPTQCERMQCLSVRLDYCRDHLKGFYLREKGCKAGQICTNCVYGNLTSPTICKCENPPYSVAVSYGQECNAGKLCEAGQGECFRPCHTYLHVTMCPNTHCVWNEASYECIDKPEKVYNPLWMDADFSDTVSGQAQNIVDQTPSDSFPIDFDTFEAAAVGYRIQGMLLENITQLETVFLNLDSNNDGLLSPPEYSMLPSVLAGIDVAVAAAGAVQETTTTMSPEESEVQARRLGGALDKEGKLLMPVDVDGQLIRIDATDDAYDAEGRRLQNASMVPLNAEVCGAQRPRKYFCSFDVSCKENCRECGWKSATDTAFSTCVRPSTTTCWADGGQVYCVSDDSCHPPGDCSRCVDRPIVDHAQFMCLALWWNPKPLTQWTDWVCRDRNKVGMPCQLDQDCVYGLRRCLLGVCAPKQPYNANHTCISDYDCPHLNYYCPMDPTNGSNPFWIQYCRRQRSEGMTCAESRECEPDLQCNTAEPQPRCRRLFSLEEGSMAAKDYFCTFGWRDRDGLCAPPAKSKEAGRSCDSDRGCMTTDHTGRTGRCVCKAWWDEDEAKYCEPVAGDYANHQEKLRDYMFFTSTRCGHFWTREECLKVYGNSVMRLKLDLDCETQKLSNGPYMPPSDCDIRDYDRFPDACARLASVR